MAAAWKQPYGLCRWAKIKINRVPTYNYKQTILYIKRCAALHEWSCHPRREANKPPGRRWMWKLVRQRESKDDARWWRKNQELMIEMASKTLPRALHIKIARKPCPLASSKIIVHCQVLPFCWYVTYIYTAFHQPPHMLQPYHRRPDTSCADVPNTPLTDHIGQQPLQNGHMHAHHFSVVIKQLSAYPVMNLYLFWNMPIAGAYYVSAPFCTGMCAHWHQPRHQCCVRPPCKQADSEQS